MEHEFEEFEFQVSRYKPETLEELCKSTRFSRKEIKLIYRGFKQECPSGQVSEEVFKEIFSQFFPQGDSTQYAHFVFNTIKHNTVGSVNFEDFIAILSSLSRGTLQEKLEWIFGLYDINGDGLITKNEMLDVVTAIYEMLGTFTDPSVDDMTAKSHVDKIFHQMDVNKDGVVTIEELIQWCCRDEKFIQSLSMLDTIL